MMMSANCEGLLEVELVRYARWQEGCTKGGWCLCIIAVRNSESAQSFASMELTQMKYYVTVTFMTNEIKDRSCMTSRRYVSHLRGLHTGHLLSS